MIGKILASGQLGKLASFVSPAFFDVMPAKALWSRGRALVAGTRNHAAFRHAVAERSNELSACLPQIELVADRKSASTGPHAAMPPEQRAGIVTELYFHQLFHGKTALLDLRGASFTPAGECLIWHPAAWQGEWAPDFIAALRDLYRGFYAKDDAMFQRGLRALSLEQSEDLFRKHFGSDGFVAFRTVDFVDTFHQVFERCKKYGVALHPDFLPLGIYLAALYDHLEDLAVAVDVAAAFERATRNSNSRAETLHA